MLSYVFELVQKTLSEIHPPTAIHGPRLRPRLQNTERNLKTTLAHPTARPTALNHGAELFGLLLIYFGKRWPMWPALPPARLRTSPHWLLCLRARSSPPRTKSRLRPERNGPAKDSRLPREEPWYSAPAKARRRPSTISERGRLLGPIGARENADRGVARAPSPRDSVRITPC